MAKFKADVDLNLMWRPSVAPFRDRAVPICAKDEAGKPISGTPLPAGEVFEVPDELADALVHDLEKYVPGLTAVKSKK